MNETTTIQQWLGTGTLNIFGMPFAGKDTQGTYLANLLNGVMISSGDILRHDHGNEEIQKIMAEGGIIPTELFAEVVVPYLSQDKYKNQPLILSEVGRMDGEQQVVMKATQESGHETKAVILLKLDDSEIWKRFEISQQQHDRGDRADDNKSVLQNRLDAYHEKVTPVIEYYRQNGLLIEIDGSIPPEKVSEAIFSALLHRAQKANSN